MCPANSPNPHLVAGRSVLADAGPCSVLQGGRVWVPKKHPPSSTCLSVVTACSHTCDLRIAAGCPSGPPVEVLLHSYPDPQWGGAEGARTPDPDPVPLLLPWDLGGWSSHLPGRETSVYRSGGHRALLLLTSSVWPQSRWAEEGGSG